VQIEEYMKYSRDQVDEFWEAVVSLCLCVC